MSYVWDIRKLFLLILGAGGPTLDRLSFATAWIKYPEADGHISRRL